MDKLVIIGGLEFLGFGLVTSFLEKGYFVECVHLEKPEDMIYEEKRFVVGRNANFHEIQLTDWLNTKGEESSLIVISLYDTFRDTTLRKKEKEIFQGLLTMEQKYKDILLLLPIQYLEQDAYRKDFPFVCEELEKRKYSIKQIYLPTLYGPWQPNEFLFQQALLQEWNEQENLTLNEDEYIQDTIYITDALNEIERIIEDNEIKTCLFKSEVADHWKKCAEFLKINSMVYKDIKFDGRKFPLIHTINVKESIGYEKGLDMQREYVLRFFQEFF
jgi:hypothetical protein